MSSPTRKKVSICFLTQGCRLNQSETAVIENQFKKETSNYTCVSQQESPDIAVINTCTVTERGDIDTKKLINKLSRSNPHVKVALVGCQAQVHKEKLLGWPHVQWVLGNSSKMQIKSVIDDYHRRMSSGSYPSDDKTAVDPENVIDVEKFIDVKKIERTAFTIPNPGIDAKHVRANIKIQDGCDFYCAFCVIPFARGPARSREFDDIFKEVEALLQAGHQEIIITGINLGTYENNGNMFVDVLKKLETYPELKRVRISSIEPTTIDLDVLKIMKSSTKLCNYFHIPLQSGSDHVLDLMKRKYNMEAYDDFISTVRKEIKDVCIGTDVIVGFPGESDEKFQETYDYLVDADIDYFHVFSYSERSLARSRRMEGQVPQHVIKKRSQLLRDLSQRKKIAYLNRFVGQTMPVLVEQKKQGFWEGFTENYVRVRFESGEQLKNTIVPINLNTVNATIGKVEGTVAKN